MSVASEGLVAEHRPEADCELSIIMPCLNEAETLECCIGKALGYLAASQISGEVVVIDNGSSDGSVAIARKAGARVLEIPIRGYGAALWHGIQHARGRYVIMGDADDSYDFSALDGFVGRLRAGDELVVGNRFQGGIARDAMPFLHRYLGNPVLSFLGRLFFRAPIGDFHCGLRGFSRERMIALELQCPGMEFASEMIVKARLHGLIISEVPTTLRVDGRSRAPHLRTWPDGWRHLKFLLLHSPRWLFLYPGMACFLFGLVLALALQGGALTLAPGLHLDVHSLVMGCMLMLVGALSVSFALVARRYAALVGLLPTSDRTARLLAGFSLERMLLLALGLLLCGGGGVFMSVLQWAKAGFGDLDYASLVRPLLLSSTVVVISLQLMFTAFLAELMAMTSGFGRRS